MNGGDVAVEQDNNDTQDTTSDNSSPEMTTKAAEAFLDFCLMGTSRSLDKLRIKYGRKPSYNRQLEEWSKLYHWQKQAKKHDDLQREERKRKAQEAIDTYNAEIIEEAKKLRAIAIGHIESLEHMHGRDAVALWKEVVAAQRLAVGAASAIVNQELSGNPDAPLTIVAQFGIADTSSEDKEEQDS